MAAAEGLPGPADLTDDQREAVSHLLSRLADDEFVLAERYTEWQVRAPTLESDLSVSNIAQDELGHARLWYDLLEDFGATEADLVWERPPGEWRHATLVELSFPEGDWADLLVRSYLYDAAEAVRLSALEGSTYARIADRVPKIREEEDYHRKHAETWLRRLTEEADGRERVRAAVERLLPHALTLFTPTDPAVETRIDDLGLRTESLAAMRGRWLEEVVPFLEGLGLSLAGADLPDPYDAPVDAVALSPAVGRDGEHTDDWDDLHADFTRTYRELGRREAHRIMRDPDDVE